MCHKLTSWALWVLPRRGRKRGVRKQRKFAVSSVESACQGYVSINVISVSVQSTVTDHDGFGGSSNGHLFLTVLEAGKSKIKMPAILCLARAHFLVPEGQLLVIPLHTENREEVRSRVFHKVANPSGPNCRSRTPPSILSRWG